MIAWGGMVARFDLTGSAGWFQNSDPSGRPSECSPGLLWLFHCLVSTATGREIDKPLPLVLGSNRLEKEELLCGLSVLPVTL